MYIHVCVKVKVKWSHYRPGVAQRVDRGIALLFHDRGTRRRWGVSSTPRPLFTPGKDPVPIVQEAGWAPGPVWTGGKFRPHRDSTPDHLVRSQSLYRLSYPAHMCVCVCVCMYIYIYPAPAVTIFIFFKRCATFINKVVIKLDFIIHLFVFWLNYVEKQQTLGRM